MSNVKTLIVYATSILMLLSACRKSEWLTEGDYFFLENKGAVMPIWVKGNISSGIFIITNHGGPGYASGHEFPISLGFQELEANYAVVYWDQRMTGLSQGDPDFNDLSIDLNIEDLEKIVELIRYKYNPESLFLLGHSWGGVLTGGYLGRENHQSYFNGWIDLDGSVQDAFEQQEKKTWILDRVDSALVNSSGQEQEFWQYIIDWYNENPNPVESDDEPYWYIGALYGYSYDWEKAQELSPIDYKELVFSSPYTLAFYWTQYNDDSWLDNYDVTEDIQNIAIPSLLLWGKQDGVVPATVAQFTYDLLGTDSLDKEIVLIDKCAHSPHYDAPYEFSDAVKAFVEKYK